MTTEKCTMQAGDIFTIAGLGIGSKGQIVFNGVSVATKRKCKSVRAAVFTVGETLSIRQAVRAPIIESA